jgi:hypothetical protein
LYGPYNCGEEREDTGFVHDRKTNPEKKNHPKKPSGSKVIVVGRKIRLMKKKKAK